MVRRIMTPRSHHLASTVVNSLSVSPPSRPAIYIQILTYKTLNNIKVLLSKTNKN